MRKAFRQLQELLVLMLEGAELRIRRNRLQDEVRLLTEARDSLSEEIRKAGRDDGYAI